MSMSTEERRRQITAMVQERRHVRNSDLSATFGVSVVTIRQDISALAELGLIHKTYGGAILGTDSGLDSAFAARAKLNSQQKQRIGAAAARLIMPGEVLILDAGTTTIEVARHLPEDADLTVITCALNVALEAGAKRGISVMVCGGVLNPRTLSLVGHDVERMLANINADHLFLAVYGADLTKGLTDRNVATAQVKRAMISAAHNVVLVCDTSKFGEISPHAVAPLDVVNHVVTNEDIPAPFAEYFALKGIAVTTT
jgi:DeoR family transcriptional regulator of aga operon